MGKEDLILKKVGTKNPFNVPDGYFDNFTKELMLLVLDMVNQYMLPIMVMFI